MENGQTIKEFIKEHSEQLSAMGVLAGLAALVGTLAVNWLGYILSFLMLSCLALIWSEIDLKHKEKFPSKLGVFKLFLRIGYFLLVLYILLTHRVISWLFLFVPFTWMLILVFLKLTKKSEKLTAFLKSPKRSHKLISFLFIAFITYITMVIGTRFAAPINIFLDALAKFNNIK